MEVCIDSVQSALAAQQGGASRLELCANLMEGGTTPTAGMLKVIKMKVSIPVFVMLRPRGGDFLYSEEELQVIKEDIRVLQDVGADGFVFGFLTKDGNVDEERCHEILDLVGSVPKTFHRAIDVSRDPMQSLEVLMRLGFDRVLTSGGASSALEGLPVIKQMVDKANGRIIVMPGGGIHEGNLQRILDGSAAREFHGSARSTLSSEMIFRKSGVPMGASLSPEEYNFKVTDCQKVKRLVMLKNDVNKN